MVRKLREAAIALVAFCSLSLQISPTFAQQATTAQQPPVTIIRETVTFIDVTFTKAGKSWDARGTGFYVFYPDKRLGENQGFVYLVTNRHVAQPEIENGQIYPVTSTHVRMNLQKKENGHLSVDALLPSSSQWFFPSDESVDLAVTEIVPDEQKFKYLTFPVSSFATKDVIESKMIAEGDSVLFAGYFYQFPGMERVEPIVREGILAMMPREEMQTTLGKNGLMYLADLHVFNGNSGSPLFVNVGGARNGTITLGGFPFMLIGVVSGYYYEDSDFKLSIATDVPKTITGKLGANSGIALVVPADQLRALLDSPQLQAVRDSVVASKTAHP